MTTIYEQAELEFPGLVPAGVLTTPDGVWERRFEDGSAFLDWRGMRQSLPRGSSPLTAFGGPIIEGQFFNDREVEAYLVLYPISINEVCVYEYWRPNK